MAPATSHIKVSSSEYVVPKKLFSSDISQLSKKSKLGNAHHTATTLNTNLLNDIHACSQKHSIQIINIWQNFITKRLFCLDHITRLLRHKGIFSPRSITWLHHKTKRVYKTKQLHLFFFLRVDSSYTQPVTRIFYNQGQLPEERQTIRQDPNLEICLGNWAYSLVSE